MKVRFYKAAALEMDEAAVYYEQQLEGLGERFLIAVKDAVERIKALPEAYSSFSVNTRRCLVNKFPYGIIYLYDSGKIEITIVAVAHLHRKPDYWRGRIAKE